MASTLQIELSDEFVNRLAEAVARKQLEIAGMAADPTGQGSGPAHGATHATPQDSPAHADPWGGGSPPQTASAPSGPTGTKTVNTPSGPRTWTFNAVGAPQCDCGDPAGLVQGKSARGTFKQWRCAKGAGDDWKSKCEFSQWG